MDCREAGCEEGHECAGAGPRAGRGGSAVCECCKPTQIASGASEVPFDSFVVRRLKFETLKSAWLIAKNLSACPVRDTFINSRQSANRAHTAEKKLISEHLHKKNMQKQM